MSERFDLVIGMGVTGQSCIRYLVRQGMAVRALDTREQPPGIEQLRADYPQVPLHTGGFREDWMKQAARLIVSPGVPVRTAEISRQLNEGKEVIGDIELFAKAASQPVAAITGSNAKSTVTSLLGEVARADGRRTAIGGNLGTPALDLLDDQVELYVLELSSFQLETTYSLDAQVATILNLSQDHLDRYYTLGDYIAAKQQIYDGCEVAVWNRDDEVTRPQQPVPAQITFGVHKEADFRLDATTGLLKRRGEALMHRDELKLPGNHNALNVLAVLAMAEALSLSLDVALDQVRRFPGLPHRCALVADHDGVRWINDSKGTNLGATLAALEGIGPAVQGKLVLIAGGQGKGQDFSVLREPAGRYLRAAVLLGEDADIIADALESVVPVHQVADMTAAVHRASELAQAGDAVLLSPACASFDLYSGYMERGTAFEKAVGEVTHAR
jgi:UDP-N-acetylmuramoylalanine--D-glutamate ligase